MQRCASCQKEIVLKETPGRREVCPYCRADLHTCFNCRFFSSTVSCQCLIPDIEPVKSKNTANFCEEFRFREYQAQVPTSEGEKARKRADDLFRNL